MLIDFQNSFTSGLSSKRVLKWSLKILPHLKYIATLPCET